MSGPLVGFGWRTARIMEHSMNDVKCPYCVSLRYSKAPPTAPGWYWQKDHHKIEQCIQVVDSCGRMCVEGFTMFGGRDFFPIVEKRGIYWAGPIEKPEAK